MIGLPGTFEALLLIALGIGYIVLYFAKREEKLMQFFGYFVGTLILALAFIFTIANLWLQSSNRSLANARKAMMIERLMQQQQQIQQQQQQRQQSLPKPPAKE